MVQSSKLWYEKLRDVPIEVAEFIVNDRDSCVFNKFVNEHQITVAYHVVDDLIITSVRDKKAIEELIGHLKS